MGDYFKSRISRISDKPEVREADVSKPEFRDADVELAAPVGKVTNTDVSKPVDTCCPKLEDLEPEYINKPPDGITPVHPDDATSDCLASGKAANAGIVEPNGA